MSFSSQSDSVSTGDMSIVSGLSSSLLLPARIDPLTKTANFAVTEAFDVYICGSGASSVTLPLASLHPGRVLHFKTVTAQTLNSDLASSVIPGNGTSAGTAILAADASGNSSTLVSNGTVWINVRRVSFEPYLIVEYPPIDITPEIVMRTNGSYYNNRFTLSGQPNGNGQYDLVMSSFWTAGTVRNAYSIFNKDSQGWLSAAGFDTTTGLGINERTVVVDGSKLKGEFVDVTFPKAMDFNQIKLKQTDSTGYPLIRELVILGNNDSSIANAPVWNQYSPLTGPAIGPTSEPSITIINNPLNIIATISVNSTFSQTTVHNFNNNTKYRTYRLLLFKILPGTGTGTAGTLDYIKFIKI